jgi:hypothetical protein
MITEGMASLFPVWSHREPISGKARIRSMYLKREQFVHQNEQKGVFLTSAATDSKTLSYG